MHEMWVALSKEQAQLQFAIHKNARVDDGDMDEQLCSKGIFC
jgi:hypothetical protein